MPECRPVLNEWRPDHVGEDARKQIFEWDDETHHDDVRTYCFENIEELQ